MKRVDRPRHDDFIALQLLSENDKLKSYPKLKRAVPVLTRGYNQYINAAGRAGVVKRVKVGGVRADLLRGHYKSLPVALAHIRRMREESSHLCCPMCGSLHSGTLDHVLPKEDYPAFSVFSLNLVPACNCNSKRGRISVGANAGERILHPYFDECLLERLLVAKFSDLAAVPRVEVVVAIDPTSDAFSAVSFHVGLIWEKTSIRSYLADRWSKMCRRPSLVVRSLESSPESLASLVQQLEREREFLDDEHGSKNNWMSVFVSGLLADDVVQWLYDRLTVPGRVPDSPLV